MKKGFIKACFIFLPVIFYFNRVHEDYHKTTDTIEKKEFKKIEKITTNILNRLGDCK